MLFLQFSYYIWCSGNKLIALENVYMPQLYLKKFCLISILCIPLLGFASNHSCKKLFFHKLLEIFKDIPDTFSKFHWIATVDAQAIRKYESEKRALARSSGLKYAINLDKLITSPKYLSKVTLEHPTTIHKYSAERGLFLYATVYTKGNIQKAKEQLRNIASSDHYHKMQWWKYTGPVWDLKQNYTWKLFVTLEHLFNGMEGYPLVSNIFFNGDMDEAFKATLELSGLPEKIFIAQTEWKHFKGQTHHFYPQRRQITNHEGNLLEEYKQMTGLEKLANNISRSKTKTFLYIQEVLNDRELQQTAWPIDILQKQTLDIILHNTEVSLKEISEKVYKIPKVF